MNGFIARPEDLMTHTVNRSTLLDAVIAMRRYRDELSRVGLPNVAAEVQCSLADVVRALGWSHDVAMPYMGVPRERALVPVRVA